MIWKTLIKNSYAHPLSLAVDMWPYVVICTNVKVVLIELKQKSKRPELGQGMMLVRFVYYVRSNYWILPQVIFIKIKFYTP